MVPVIVNAVLNEHQLVIDIVAFVIKGDFHRSRLGEKQRGKILAGWVTRKMRTIAQYSIRDPNGPENQMMISEEPVGRTSTSLSAMMRGPGSTKGSIRDGSNLGMVAQLNSMQLQQAQNTAISEQVPGQAPPLQHEQFYDSPGGFSDTPGARESIYPASIPELSTANHGVLDPSDKTPTNTRMSFLPDLAHEAPGNMDYSPIDRAGPFGQHTAEGREHAGPGDYNYQQQTYGDVQVPEILRPGPEEMHTHQQPFYSDSQPYEYDYQPEPFTEFNHQQHQHEQQGGAPRWSFDSASDDGRGYQANNGGGGGLRVANRDSGSSQDSWAKDALAGMDFAGGANASPEAVKQAQGQAGSGVAK